MTISEYRAKALESNADHNAYLAIFDTPLQTTETGLLAKVPIAVKDIMALEGERLTCGSRMLENFRSLYTATAVQRLLDAGAVVIGKTNMDEFAMGSSNETSAFGPVKNPWDLARVPGGSSGGSAAAVASGSVRIAIGTDTGGSVRQPAAFTGTVGMKPTYGRISRFGLTAFASSFDTVGTFSRTLEDAALALSVMSGKDPLDATSADVPIEDYVSALGASPNGLRIGIPKEYFGEGIEPDVRAAVEKSIEKLRAAGCEIVDVELPLSKYGIAVYYILTTAEASSNLARFDGIRYGHRSTDAQSLEETYTISRSEGFGAEVKRRIMLGTYVLSSGYYDAYYARAQTVRRLISEDFDRVFRSVDLILTPTTPTTAFKFGEKVADPLAMYLNDIFTVSANIAGIPAISVPVGLDGQGLPIGAQLMAPNFKESVLFTGAAAIHQDVLAERA